MCAAADSKTFAGKFLEKIDKISREEIEAFLARLLKEKDLFETVLNHMLEGVAVVDAEGRALFINRAARAMLGLAGKRRIIGAPLLDQIEPGEMSVLLGGYNPARDGIRDSEIVVRTPEERVIRVTFLPVSDEAAQLASTVIFLRDATAERRDEKQRMQAERLASLATLTAGVAHEVKNPLNSLKIHAHLLKKALAKPEGGADPAQAKRAERSAAIMVEEIDRLSRVVDDFLQAARPSQPQIELRNVNDVLGKLALLMEAEVAQRRIKVEMELDSRIPPTRVDEVQLSLAFRNILKNSLEAIEHAEGRILIRTYRASGSIIIEFRDNGAGIPPEIQQKIFEPYFTTKFSGTGLGLMVVYRIVTEHNGKISVQSEEGKGALFRIELPLDNNPQGLLKG